MHNLLRFNFFQAVFFVFAAAVFGVIFGCSIHEPRPVVVQKELNRLQPETLIEKEKQRKPLGPPPFTEKLAPAFKGIIKETRLYSLVFENASLREVLNAIASDTDLNLSVESEVNLDKSITVHLKNVTFKESLDMIIKKGAGYTWKIENGCININRFEEKIYHFDYLDIISKTNIEVGGDMLASSVEAGSGESVKGKFEINSTRSEENTDVWAEVLAGLEGIKSAEGILRVNRNGGIIYMADFSGKIESMVRFLDALSESLNRQVFIEARIMEVALTDSNKYGIDWSSFEAGSNGLKDLLPDSFELTFNSGGMLVLTDKDSSFINGFLDFLSTQGDVTVLAKPHLSVMNAQSALLTVGYQFPYGDISGVDRDTESGLITYGTSIKRAVLGLQLGITPRISKDGIVALHIVPTITRIKGEQEVEIPTSAVSKQTVSNPVIDLQEIATMVRVRDRQSVVLAGLITRIKNIKHEGLPVLGALPFIGNFFKHMEETTENKELVILITPYIKKI